MGTHLTACFLLAAAIAGLGSCGAPPAAGEHRSEVAPPAVPWSPAPSREGGAIARGAHDEALYLADEDHAVLRVVPLAAAPATTISGPIESVPMPGPPANVLALSDRILVTIRDPGLLVSLVRRDGQLVIAQSVPLPPDAWGLAITPDERTALVTSAWSHRVSAVDLAAGTVRWSLDVAREPRGVVVTAGGNRAYVTHLVGAPITRIDLRAHAPSASRCRPGA